MKRFLKALVLCLALVAPPAVAFPLLSGQGIAGNFFPPQPQPPTACVPSGCSIGANSNLLNTCSIFNSADWAQFGGSGGTGPSYGSTVNDPNGNNDALQVTFTDPRSGFRQTPTPQLAPSTQYTATIYYKLISGTPNFYMFYYNGSSPATQYSSEIIPTNAWVRSISFTFTTGTADAAPSIGVANANIDGASQGNDGTVALWGMKLELGNTATTFNGCAPVANGRQFLVGAFTAGVASNVGATSGQYATTGLAHTLGFNPDFVSDFQNPNGALGGPFFWQQQGVNYPFASSIYPSTNPNNGGESNASVADYQNTSNGTNDSLIQATLNSLGAGPTPSPLIYIMDIDREWGFNSNAFTAGQAAVVGAWKRISNKIHTQFPNVRRCIAVIADATYFGEQPFLDALASTDVDCVSIDVYFHANRFANAQAAWTAVYGFANPSGPQSGAPQGSLAFWINYAHGRGWPVALTEWADDFPSPNDLVLNNMATIIKNPANNIVSSDYWSNTFLENGQNEILTGAKQTQFVTLFGVNAIGANYTGTFIPNWAASTQTQLNALEASGLVPY